MRNIKAREIKTIAKGTYSARLKKVGITFKNYYRQLKKEYVEGNYSDV